jgi:hypothetical protein
MRIVFVSAAMYKTRQLRRRAMLQRLERGAPV